MYKIAVIGEWDSIYGFSALGLDTFRVEDNDPGQGSRLLDKLCAQDYAVIYITEALAAVLPAEIEAARLAPRPAVILIPGISGNTGEGLAAVKKSVEQAVGSDLLFGD